MEPVWGEQLTCFYVTSELTAAPARNDGRRAGGGLLGRREGPRPSSEGGCRRPWVLLG